MPRLKYALYTILYALYAVVNVQVCFAIPGVVCNLLFVGDVQAPTRAATVTACDPAAVLSDRTVETNFPACLAPASKQISRYYLPLRLAVVV